MKLLYTTKLGSVISECETDEDVAESFGCIGFTYQGCLAKQIAEKQPRQQNQADNQKLPAVNSSNKE